MHITSAAMAGLAVHQAAAIGGYGGWGGMPSYSTPGNTDNKCSDKQTKGYDWSDLSTGSFDDYGSNKFSGWSCSNSFGKRDLLSGRSFQSKCITSNLDHEPAIECDGKEHMSITEYQVSSDKDAQIECHYEMPDGSACKEVHSCSAGGSVIKNTQCGGAKKVTFKPAGDSKGQGCNIGVHKIDFDCEAPVTPPSYSVSSSSASSFTQPPVYSTGSSPSSPETTSIPSYGSSSSDAVPSYLSSSKESVPAYSSSSSATAPSYSTSSIEGSPVTTSETIPVYPYPSSSAENIPSTHSLRNSGGVPSYPSSSDISVPAYSSSSSKPAYPSSSATAVSPISSSIPASPYPPKTLPGYGNFSAPASSQSIPSYGSTTESGPPPVETVSYPKPQCPDVLPKCLSTWMYLTPCKDNSDYDCFCKNSDFMGKVYNCLSAWSSSDDDTNSGAGYLMGLCAQYVPENPAVITACPTTITPAAGYTPPTSTPDSPASSGAVPIPSSPAPYSSGRAPVPSGSASAPAPSAPASNPKTGKTVTQYSTIISTIRNCGPEVTNCPGSSAQVATSTRAVSTYVETAPASSSTEASPVPGITSAPSLPCTTITYSSTFVVPATYPTGESQGATIPSSSYTTSLVTTVTVPQVQITTYTVTEGGSTHEAPGLGYQPPAPSSPAGSGFAPSAPVSAPAPYPTSATPASPIGGSSSPAGFGTTYVPPSSPSSSSIVPYTGAGATLSRCGAAGVLFSAFVMGFFL